MEAVDELLPWYWLLSSHGIGPLRVRHLIEYLGSPQMIMSKTVDDYKMVPKVGRKTAETLEETKSRLPEIRDQVNNDLKLADTYGAKILTLENQNYPPLLKMETNIAPPILYVLGEETILKSKKNVAVVGTRSASASARAFAKRTSRDLAFNGWSIISGLAAGIDTQGHLGALEARGSTVAVLGGGIDQIYPKENRALADSIANSGVLLSERRFGVRPLGDHLRKRNHIIAAISAALIAVEFPRGSGTEIAVRKAIEQSKPVFAYQADIAVPSHASGSLQLIRDFIAYPLTENTTPTDIEQAINAFNSSRVAVIFDLDGVLVDTRQLELESLAKAVAENDGIFPREEFSEGIEGSPKEILRGLSDGSIDEMLSSYHRAWFGLVDKKVQPLVKIARVLSEIRSRSIKLAVATARNRKQALALLAAANLDREFPIVVTWGDTRSHKPNPEPLQEAIRQLGYPEVVISVGDRPQDGLAAKSAGIEFVGATWFLSEAAESRLKKEFDRDTIDSIVDLPGRIDKVKRMKWVTQSSE